MSQDMRFLVVDDFPMIRTMLKKSLSDLGYKNVMEAVDGLDAFEKLQQAVSEQNLPRVIFLDWNMPRMTGIELITKCRSIPELSQVPIIMISAERDHKNVVTALKAGANDYILKPFSPKTLSDKLGRLLESLPAAKAGNQ